MVKTKGRIRIGVTHGMRGYFAVMVDDDGPILSGIGSFDTPEGARREAIAWARDEQVGVDFEVGENDV